MLAVKGTENRKCVMPEETSWEHRSKNWGGKFHVDKYEKGDADNVTARSDGHSPTLNPPPCDGNTIKIKSPKGTSRPFGNVRHTHCRTRPATVRNGAPQTRPRCAAEGGRWAGREVHS